MSLSIHFREVKENSVYYNMKSCGMKMNKNNGLKNSSNENEKKRHSKLIVSLLLLLQPGKKMKNLK